MRVGDKVEATRTITGLFRPTIRQGAAGVVVRVGHPGFEVRFTVPGVMGGDRTVIATVRSDEIAKP